MVIRRTASEYKIIEKKRLAAEKIREESREMEAIDGRCIYTSEEFKRLSGMAETSLRKARKNGLVILKSGQKRFIRGVDWEDYLLKLNNAEHLRRIPNSMGYTPTLKGISPECIYPVVDVFRISGIRASDIRQMKRTGMPVSCVGGRDYVYGQDLIESIRKQSEINETYRTRGIEQWET